MILGLHSLLFLTKVKATTASMLYYLGLALSDLTVFRQPSARMTAFKQDLLPFRQTVMLSLLMLVEQLRSSPMNEILIKTPRAMAIEQLIAYNDRDLEAFCALFADDAVLMDMPSGQVVAAGMTAIRDVYRERFSNPDLYCKVHASIDIGDFAIDHETVYGLPDGELDAVAMYEVKDNLIQRVFFIRN